MIKKLLSAIGSDGTNYNKDFIKLKILLLCYGGEMKNFFSLTVIFVFLIISCKTNRSNINIINGIEDVNNKYPAVLSILMKAQDDEYYIEDINNENWSGCSSSVISHNTLLTASHCLVGATHSDNNGKTSKDGGIVRVKLDSGKMVKAKDFYINQKYLDYDEADDDFADSKYDVGIVVFEDHTFDGITPLKISNQVVKEGTKVQLVGYSCQTKVGSGRDLDDPEWEKPRPLDVCKDIANNRNGHIRRYGTSTVYKNTLCPPDTLQVMTSLKNANYNPEDRVDPIGLSSAQWFGDSGGPTLLYDNQNLIVAMPAIVVGTEDLTMTGACNNTFNPEIIKWLKHINDTTDALIPMDEVK